jgi:hypothetical protein
VIQSGHDFARQVSAIEDGNVLLTATFLDAPACRDTDQDPTHWSPMKYLSHLAKSNPAHPGLYGENTGAGSPEDMRIAVHQMRRYDLAGMAWYDEEQLFSDHNADLKHYEDVIESSSRRW